MTACHWSSSHRIVSCCIVLYRVVSCRLLVFASVDMHECKHANMQTCKHVNMQTCKLVKLRAPPLLISARRLFTSYRLSNRIVSHRIALHRILSYALLLSLLIACSPRLPPPSASSTSPRACRAALSRCKRWRTSRGGQGTPRARGCCCEHRRYRYGCCCCCCCCCC